MGACFFHVSTLSTRRDPSHVHIHTHTARTDQAGGPDGGGRHGLHVEEGRSQRDPRVRARALHVCCSGTLHLPSIPCPACPLTSLASFPGYTQLARHGGVRAAQLAHPPLQRRHPARPGGRAGDARGRGQPPPARLVGAQHQVDPGPRRLHGQGHQARAKLAVRACLRACPSLVRLLACLDNASRRGKS